MTQIETNNEIEDKKSLNFIEQIVEADLKAGKNGGRLNTRFPPEPNGYLHIGESDLYGFRNCRKVRRYM